MKTFQRAADWLRKDVPYVMEMAAQGQYALINIVAGYQDAEERAVGIAEQWNK